MVDENELNEYVYYINVGNSFANVMEGLAVSNSGHHDNILVGSIHRFLAFQC